MSAPLRLKLDGEALAHNWAWLQSQGSARCGAAVKANGYGLGVADVVQRLVKAGCRDFFVATWAEAAEIEPLMPVGARVSVLHGVRNEDMAQALTARARPVLNTMAQVARWRPTGRPCDVMIDTGMNRLGLSAQDDLSGLSIQSMMSHLASADEDVAQNAQQLKAFQAAAAGQKGVALSLANSAGICLGRDYHFDLTRPGLALYGGVPRPEAVGQIRRVVRMEAQILQRRRIQPGDPVGYNATFRAQRTSEVAILNLGYADGYLRSFSGKGSAENGLFPVLGRVSMDLTAIDVTAQPDLAEGDWVELDFDLPSASVQSGLSQYELLTLLGQRFERRWS
jgi:alanine racemase